MGALLFFFGGIAVLFFVEIAGDAFIIKTWGSDFSISDQMHRARRIVVFAFGLLYGATGGFLAAHFWWGVGAPDV